jgi:hypothetical protein
MGARCTSAGKGIGNSAAKKKKEGKDEPVD